MTADVFPSRSAVVTALLLLAFAGPQFVRMPLNSDTALYDVQADCVLKGGVLYRDIIEPNLPGVVWIHLAVRSIAGWSTEAMRLFDLAVVVLVTGLLSALCRRKQSRSLICVAVPLFYLGCNEWCHCQRDTWMLLPALAAMCLRCAAVRADFCCHVRTRRNAVVMALLEGMCWGAAFWLKPHVAVPAVAVLLASVPFSKQRRRAVNDLLFVIGGGLLSAVPGIAWMIANGAWPHFTDMMFSWNPEYLDAGRRRQSLERWIHLCRRFFPWCLVHVGAVPLAVSRLAGVWRLRAKNGRQAAHVLLSVMYLAWLLQSLLLQHAMDYIHVPGIVLGLCVLFEHGPWHRQGLPKTIVVAASVILITANSVLFRPERLNCWTACLRDSASTQLRAKLAHGNFPDWEALEHVCRFLEEQNVRDGDVTCVNVHSVHVFRQLRIQPATRYWATSMLMELFPSRRNIILTSVMESGSRFYVTEERESELLSVPHSGETFPWNLPVVYQYGSYRVHEASSDWAESGVGPRRR